MNKIRNFIRRKKAEGTLDRRLTANQVRRGKRAVDDQHLGKGVTVPVKRQMQENNLRVEDLEGMIRALNKFNHANVFIGYNHEINNRNREAIRKRGIRGKKSRYLLTGLNGDDYSPTESIRERTQKRWKRFRNGGRPPIEELSETGRELWAAHALKKAGVAKDDKQYPKILHAVANIVELHQIEMHAGKQHYRSSNTNMREIYGKEMHDTFDRRAALQANLLKMVGEKKGLSILEALHQMMVHY